LTLSILYVLIISMILENIMILISYSNNETLEFTTVSSAMSYTLDMFVSGIVALGIRSSNASDFKHLQDYIAGLHNSIQH